MRQNFIMLACIVAIWAVIKNFNIAALKREVKEETRFLINVKQLFCVSSNTKKHKEYGNVQEVPIKIIFDFICEIADGEIKSSSENSDTEFIHKNKVLDYIKASGIKKDLRLI